jgi:trimeric autotransporter adhesin
MPIPQIKRICLVIFIIITAFHSYAQRVGINEDGSIPNANAILDIKSFNKGVLLPRISSGARGSIPFTKGLLVYDTTTNSFWYNNGSAWVNMAQPPAQPPGWSLRGNNAISDSHFLGTTDPAALIIKVNNVQAGRIAAGKNTLTLANTFWGYGAGASTPIYNDPILHTSISNTGIGHLSLHANTLGYSNTAVGANSLRFNTTGFSNIAIGQSSLYFNSSGGDNIAIGVNALSGNTTGWGNVSIGTVSSFSNNSGRLNTVTGFNAFYSNISGNENTVSGNSAMFSNIDGYRNTAIGVGALGANTSGYGNTSTGSHSMWHNTTGYSNTGIGDKAMWRNTTGIYNTAIGQESFGWNTVGSFNVASGTCALFNNASGNFNTAIGAFAEVNSGNLTNATAIGFGAFVNASNKVRIGNNGVISIEGAVPFTTPSDGRFKFGVQENVKGLDFILQLRPVTYQVDVERFDKLLNEASSQAKNIITPAIGARGPNEAGLIRRSGFIAQEVEEAANKAGYNFSGVLKPKTDKEYYSLSYESFVVPLVKSVQELHAEIERLKKELAALKKM